MSDFLTSTSSSLFTDKYRPKKYCDLLTEEKINREILTWMKSCDEIVFHKKFNIPKIPIMQNEFNHSSNQDKNKSKMNNNTKQPQNNQPLYYEVEYVQSKHKILLISGPPGTGKTTLAYIIAEHCGYEPVVVNASDERTADKLITRIYDTTLMHNVKKSKKPTCLILDEIDGIAGDYSGTNSIRNIIDFVKFGKVNKGIIKRNKAEVLSGTGGNSKNLVSFDGVVKRNKTKTKDIDEESDDDSESHNEDDNESGVMSNNKNLFYCMENRHNKL